MREVIESWKMTLMALPRIFCICASDLVRISSLLNKMEPPVIFPGGVGIRRMIDWAVTLLPQPDSPTIAKTSPALRSKLTLRTALTTPA